MMADADLQGRYLMHHGIHVPLVDRCVRFPSVIGTGAYRHCGLMTLST